MWCEGPLWIACTDSGAEWALQCVGPRVNREETQLRCLSKVRKHTYGLPAPLYYWPIHHTNVSFYHMAFTSKLWRGRGLTQASLEILVVVTSCVFFEVVPMPGFVMVLLMQLTPKLGLADRGLLKCGFAWNGPPWGVCTCVSFGSVPHVGSRLWVFKVRECLGGWIQKPLCTINGGGRCLWEMTTSKNSYLLTFQTVWC